MLNIIFILITVFIAYVLPALQRKQKKVKKAVGRNNRRHPSNYGNIYLDGRMISQCGRGVLNPNAMYSETNKEKPL